MIQNADACRNAPLYTKGVSHKIVFLHQVGITEPELYVYNDPMINAYTYGETRTFIALSSSLVERMSKEELKGVIAHECGHILCRHMLYLTMYETLKEMGVFLGLIPWMMFSPLYLALQYWNRKSELSADRCGAAVVGEEIYQSVLIKLASGMKEDSRQPDCLVEQGKAYEALKHSSLWNRIQQEYQCIFIRTLNCVCGHWNWIAGRFRMLTVASGTGINQLNSAVI